MNKNIISHEFYVTKKQRNKLNNHTSFLIWFTGLSGAGKSTIANALENKLNDNSIHTYLLDGDNIRQGLNVDLTFSQEDRSENIKNLTGINAPYERPENPNLRIDTTKFTVDEAVNMILNTIETKLEKSIL